MTASIPGFTPRTGIDPWTDPGRRPVRRAARLELVGIGSGMDWHRTLHGAWLVLRANQLWAPLPDNNPDGARACMRRFYALLRLSYGQPASPAETARLEVDWWSVHRERQYSTELREAGDALVESVTRLYSYLSRVASSRWCASRPGGPQWQPWNASRTSTLSPPSPWFMSPWWR
ncbi:MAG TPA: hypothetical protein VMU94_07335 [Streptosporangiaceae bacterium]|nr:hypothetical protein [Streptosporangiaceae bacterium]